MIISYSNLKTFFLLGSLVISSDTVKAVDPVEFTASEFDVAFKYEFDLEIEALNEVRNARSISSDWADTDYFRQSSGDFSLLDTAQYAPLITPPPANCRDSDFGLDGSLTDACCSVYEAITDKICAATNPTEPSCDNSKLPHLIAAKGEMLQQPGPESVDANFAWALCITIENLNQTLCDETNLPGSNLLAANTAGLQIIEFPGLVPPFESYNNPILTFANDAVLPQADGSTWSNYALGDGRFEFIRRLYARQPFRQREDPKYSWNFNVTRPSRWEVLDAKATVVNTIVQQYAHQVFPEESVNEYHHDAVLGNILQRHADDIFGPPLVAGTERTAVMEGALFRYRTACAVPLGIMSAHYCAFEPKDMKGLVRTFLNSKYYNIQRQSPFKITSYPTCGRWSQDMWQLAKRAMNKPASDTPLYQGPDMLTNFRCLKRIFQF